MIEKKYSMSFYNLPLSLKAKECFAARSVKWGDSVLDKMKYSFNLIHIKKSRYLHESEKNFIRMFGVEEGLIDEKKEG